MFLSEQWLEVERLRKAEEWRRCAASLPGCGFLDSESNTVSDCSGEEATSIPKKVRFALEDEVRVFH